MAFVLTKKRTVLWPVKIDIPTDGGNTIEGEFSVVFEILQQHEYDALFNSDIKFLMRVVVGFGDDLQGEDGQPLEFNEYNKAMLIKSEPFIRVGLINAYHAAAAGIASKNSKGSAPSGQPARKQRKKRRRN
jgi:hypothetical protein